MRLAVLSAVVCAALLTVSGGSVAADCVGPTIEIGRREIVRGDELVIIGSGWGDNCYDTGAPPAGEGVLGVPITGISVYIVQGAAEWHVAAGAADADYEFEVAVFVPTDLQSGSAEVQARYGGGIAYSPDPQFVVADAPALAVAGPQVVSFGPSPATTTVAPTTSPPLDTPPEASSDVTSAPSADSTMPTLDAEARARGEQSQGTRSRSTSTFVLVVGGLAATLVAAGVVARSRRG